jgi:hypothetical protein
MAQARKLVSISQHEQVPIALSGQRGTRVVTRPGPSLLPPAPRPRRHFACVREVPEWFRSIPSGSAVCGDPSCGAPSHALPVPSVLGLSGADTRRDYAAGTATTFGPAAPASGTPVACPTSQLPSSAPHCDYLTTVVRPRLPSPNGNGEIPIPPAFLGTYGLDPFGCNVLWALLVFAFRHASEAAASCELRLMRLVLDADAGASLIPTYERPPSLVLLARWEDGPRRLRPVCRVAVPYSGTGVPQLPSATRATGLSSSDGLFWTRLEPEEGPTWVKAFHQALEACRFYSGVLEG